MRSLRPLLSAILFLPLLAFSLHDFTVMTADAAVISESNLQITMQAFKISNTSDYSLVSNQPTAAGSFVNGALQDYPEGSCIPIEVDAKNKSGAAGDIFLSISFDYFGTAAVGVDHFEAVTSSTTPMENATNLNQITLPGSSLTSVASFAASSGSVSAIVDGPYSGDNAGTAAATSTDVARHYNISLSGVPDNETAYVSFCARLGENAAEYNGGAQLSIRTVQGGKENVAISPKQILRLPELTVIKNVVNDNGGLLSASDFTLNVVADTATPSSFPGSSSGTIVNFNPGSYSVSEVANSGYIASYSAACVGSLDYNQSATCTVTNDDSASATTLTVIKQVVNDNGGTLSAGDFTMNVFVNDVLFTSFPGDEAGTTVSIPADAPYYITETMPGLGYGDGGTQTPECTGTLAFGDNKTCTVVNDDIPSTLKVIKLVDNDVDNDGIDEGTAQPSDFELEVTGSLTFGPWDIFDGSNAGHDVSMDAGAYTVTENPTSASANYTASFSGDCSASGATSATGTMVNGQDQVCTVTNTYFVIPPTTGTITVNKIVNNTYGGSATVNDFNYFVGIVQVTAGAAVTFDAGTYQVSEGVSDSSSISPSLYTATYSDDCSSDGSIDLAAGEDLTCTITNNQNPPAPLPTENVLPVLECVLQNGPSDYTAFWGYNSANSTDVYIPIGASNFFSGSTNDLGQPIIFNPGATDPYPTYVFSTDFDGSDLTWSLTSDATFSATASSDPALACPSFVPGELNVVTLVVNDNGGAMVSSDATMTVAGTNVLPSSTFAGSDTGVVVTMDPGTYSVAGSSVAGYTVTSDCDSGTDSIANGDHLTCTVTYDDIAVAVVDGTITVNKVVVNDNGGKGQVADFTYAVSGDSVDSGEVNSFAPGTYTVTEAVALFNGDGVVDGDYTATFSGDCDASGVIVLSASQNAICTITNDDVAPLPATLIVIKHVINDSGSSQVAGDFVIDVSGTNVSSSTFAGSEAGVTVTLDAGDFSVSEANPGSYSATYTADCSGTIAAGETKTCTVTNDDVATGGGGGTQSAGSGNGGGSGAPGPINPPAGQVLGDTDTSDPVADPADPATPTGEVLGATDEQLPRTGFPVEAVELMVGSALFYATRPRK